MLLIVSIIMAVVALMGMVWILVGGLVTTVDGLFMSLILLVISGIFAANARWEYRQGGARSLRPSQRARADQFVSQFASDGASVLRGTIQNVQFFEAHVGQPTKSVVTLANGPGSSRIIVLQGDMRNRLPAGKQVQLLCRDENGLKTLISAEYS